MEMGTVSDNELRSIKKLWKDTAGTSMVSVITAFVLLLIAIGMLHTAITAAGNMINKARKNDVQNETVIKEFYKQKENSVPAAEQKIVSLQSGSVTLNIECKLKEITANGTEFYLFEPGATPTPMPESTQTSDKNE